MPQFFDDYIDRLGEHLNDLRAAIKGVSQEGLDWVPSVGMNSLAVLVVHTCGSGRYWVGDVGLGEPSERNRDAEFKVKGTSEADLLQKIDAFENYVQNALKSLALDDLQKNAVGGARRLREDVENKGIYSIGWTLLHTLEHTAVHVGHAQITRELWDKQVQ